MTKMKILALAAATSAAALVAANGPAFALSCPEWPMNPLSDTAIMNPNPIPGIDTCEDLYGPVVPIIGTGMPKPENLPTGAQKVWMQDGTSRYLDPTIALWSMHQPKVFGNGINKYGDPIRLYPDDWRRDIEQTPVNQKSVWVADWVDKNVAELVWQMIPQEADPQWKAPAWDDFAWPPPDSKWSDFAAISGGKHHDARELDETLWSAPNLDPEGIVEEKRQEHFDARVRELGLGFKAAGQATVGIFGYEFNRFLAAMNKSPEDILESAFEIEEALRPTLNKLEETSDEIRAINKEARDAKAEEKYYRAEIGSDIRRTNLSFEMAEDGYRYERQRENGTFVDAHGNMHETEIFDLPAENRPEFDPSELPA